MSSRFLRSKRAQLLLRRKTWKPPVYPKMPAGIPAFAAKPHTTYKIRNKILAGGKNVQFGNNVSEFFNRTRRMWRPNIKVKSLWSEALGRRVRLRMVTSVLRTVDKVGGLDAYLTCTTRRRMKELGPRGWEIRAAVIEMLRQKERGKYIRMFQRSILLCPELRMDSHWKDIRPYVKHTEGYAVLPEEYCKKAFKTLMERLRENRPVLRRRVFKPETIVLTNAFASQFVRKVKSGETPKHTEKTLKPRKPRPIRKSHVSRSKGISVAQVSTSKQGAEDAKAQRKDHKARLAKQRLRKQKWAERKARVAKAIIKEKKRRKALLS